MSRQLALAAIVCSFMACVANSQDAVSKWSASVEQAEDRSFHFGKPVTHPEELSGVWEAPDDHGGAIGLHLMLGTAAPADATTLVGTEQAWLHLDVGIYQRAGAMLQFGEQGYFSDSPRGGGVRYEGGRLTLHSPEYDLDLLRAPGDRWVGRVHRKQFDSQVTLARTGTGTERKKMWFVGTWRTGSTQFQTCLHIAGEAPGQFTGWSDTLVAMGPDPCPPHAPKRPYSYEYYGELAKVHAEENGSVSIELGAYNGICCSHTVLVAPAENGTVMKADWPSGPNQAPHQAEWKKMPGDSCIVPVP